MLQMHVILTHEQADFDAIASLLAASLLDESAVPVLPRRMNRNVRAFLVLYGAELPFVDPRDLRGDPIDRVTLVDTQSIVSLKGMSDETRVHVIDHHSRRDNLSESWTVITEDLGSTTTLLLEAIQEQDGLLTPIQATLLLLGIYEDTGSLTYSRTTARDVRAAAYLLDHGASLTIAADYLNHPLSKEQQALYEELIESTEHHQIHDQTVVVATADATGLDEELSTLAHKMRDLLDPDALILIMKTGGGVQLIARSNSENIDVSAIAAIFGGGGHSRAAAGLIRNRQLEDVHQELVAILPKHVSPSVTVAEIMSRGPQLLTPDTPVEEAARRMRVYGYEGYPVVEEGRVLGLLTRRAVDRAIAHKLNLSASSLMNAGEYTVDPGDSIEHLQRLMIESGWGQIPVVHPENGEIIGIVTRTDLLKTLAPQPRLPGRRNLSRRLEAALPEPHLDLIKAVANAAHEHHCALYIVGGFVRDLLLEKPSLDYDLVVEGDAISLAHALARRHGGRVTTHARFGTAKWQIGDRWAKQDADAGSDAPLPEWLDLVSARREFYTHPTALPTVERGSIKLDLHRRDFTINTLALRLDGRHYGELHDYWGGLDDLHSGTVRVLHSLSFVDDPTRMLRAVRFEQRFGFEIEQRTLELLLEALPLLEKVSGDRIRHEMDHILEERRIAEILTRLEDLGLLEAIHPALEWDTWIQSRLEALVNKQPDELWGLERYKQSGSLHRDLSYTLWLLRLPVAKVRQVSKRLKLPSYLHQAILEASKLWTNLPELKDAPPSDVVRRLEDASPIALYSIYRATSDIHLRKLLQQYAAEWSRTIPITDGHRLRKLGLPPGPVYSQILARLRDAWLDGEISTPEEEVALLERLLQDVDGADKDGIDKP